jgi:hypothetical protein
MESIFAIECADCFGFEGWRISYAGAHRATGASSINGGNAWLAAAELLHHPHLTVMLAVSPAARWEIRASGRSDERRNQRQAEKHHQRDGDGAAHNQAQTV